MPTVSLRELVAAGGCGPHFTAMGPRNRGWLHAVFDEIAAANLPNLARLADENFRTMLANQNNIPYEDLPYFHRVLMGIAGHDAALATYAANPYPIQNFEGTPIRHVTFFKADHVLELQYDYFTPQHWFPVTSLLRQHLTNPLANGAIMLKVRTLSVLGEMDVLETYPINGEALSVWLKTLTTPDVPVAGPMCLRCPVTACSFQTPFEQAVRDYFKAEQAVKEREARLMQHLTAHGPTPCGLHLVYPKEHKRRFFSSDKDFGAFWDLLQKHSPKDFRKYLSPDLAEVVRGVERGDLPVAMLNFIKERHYYKLETAASL